MLSAPGMESPGTRPNVFAGWILNDVNNFIFQVQLLLTQSAYYGIAVVAVGAWAVYY